MKELLIAVQAEHVYNILTGKKKLEIRKQIPKSFSGWVYIYCTKSESLYWSFDFSNYHLEKKPANFIISTSSNVKLLSGKVVARFWFDDYETFNPGLGNPRIYVNACVDDRHCIEYANGKKLLYAMHIKYLVIFDKPKELSDLYKVLSDRKKRMLWENHLPQWEKVTRAPQNYMYVKKDKLDWEEMNG